MSTIFRHVYHIAPVSAMDRIRVEGLLPVERAEGQNWKHIVYDRPSIFVLSRRTPGVIDEVLSQLCNKHLSEGEDHENWTDEDWSRFEQSLVLLTVDLSLFQFGELGYGTRSGPWVHERVLYVSVPPSAIIETSPVHFSWTEDEGETQ